MTRNGRKLLYCLGTAAIAFAVVAVDGSSQEETGFPQMLRRMCEDMGGVLYMARDSPDTPAICHRKGAPLSSEASLEEWREVLFVEGQL